MSTATPIQHTAASAVGGAQQPATDPPIFTLSRMNIDLNQNIDMLVVNNKTMIVSVGNVLSRISLRPAAAGANPFERLPDFPMGVRVVRLFLDPRGQHLLMTVLRSAEASVPTGSAVHELWYLHRSSREPRCCERYRGHDITAVGWNRSCGSDTQTGSILLGTSRGVIFEAEFNCLPGDKRANSAINWKQLPNYLPLYGCRDVDGVVFDIGKGKAIPICALELHKVPQTGRHTVVALTATQLYTFFEDLTRIEERYPYLHHIFSTYLTKPERTPVQLDNQNGHAVFRFVYDAPTDTYPRSYGLLTSTGFTISDVDPCTESDQFLLHGDSRPFPPVFDDKNVALVPISFEFTEFHVIFLYADRLVIVTRLTEAIVLENRFDSVPNERQPAVGLVRDGLGNVSYVFRRKDIRRIRINDEKRNVWRQHLERGDYVAAQKATSSAADLNQILITEANDCYARADFVQAAKRFADSRACFETVCLRFLRDINANAPNAGETGNGAPTQREALMVFVRGRLDKLRNADQTQITMLVMWLFELYLIEMASATGERQRRLRADLQTFVQVARVANCVREHVQVFYGLIATHGDIVSRDILCNVNDNHGAVIAQHIENGRYSEALQVLASNGKHISAELFYEYAPILLEELPRATVDVLCQQDVRRIDPERLLPALMCVDTKDQRECVRRYLEWCTKQSNSQPLHNYLVRVYAQWWSDRLIDYLTAEGTDAEHVHYDVQYALRVCLQHECQAASVLLYRLLHLWQPAVELAITFNLQLAKDTASMEQIDEATRRQLWLKIAEHQIRGCTDVRQELSLLGEKGAKGVLRIEDVLPFFADFERIEDFKEAVIEALCEYNSDVDAHRQDMVESAKAAEQVRDELQAFRQRSVRVRSNECCSLCRTLALHRAFFVFQCGHVFHMDCMERELVAKHFSSAEKQRLSVLHKRITAVQQVVNISADGNEAQMSDQERAQNEYDDMLSGECLFCGDYMIEMIDLPFVNCRLDMAL